MSGPLGRHGFAVHPFGGSSASLHAQREIKGRNRAIQCAAHRHATPSTPNIYYSYPTIHLCLLLFYARVGFRRAHTRTCVSVLANLRRTFTIQLLRITVHAPAMLNRRACTVCTSFTAPHRAFETSINLSGACPCGAPVRPVLYPGSRTLPRGRLVASS